MKQTLLEQVRDDDSGCLREVGGYGGNGENGN